jgi:hypothetical protein
MSEAPALITAHKMLRPRRYVALGFDRCANFAPTKMNNANIAASKREKIMRNIIW